MVLPRPLAGTLDDLRLAVRSLARSPRFTVGAIAILAAALGASTAVFSVVSGVLLQPLPYPDPDRLVRIDRTLEPIGPVPLSGPELAEYRDRARSLTAVAGACTLSPSLGAELTGRGAPRRVKALPVTAGYFETLGVGVRTGRTFVRPDERDGAREIILTARLAVALGLDRQGAVGTALALDGVPRLVVGVMPPGFRDPFDADIDVWAPSAIQASVGNHYLMSIGRLAPGATVGDATRELVGLTTALYQQRARRLRGAIRVATLHDEVVGDSTRLLAILFGFVALVVLLAAANVANLVMARGVGRGRDLAIRAALGAGRGRLFRQTVAEGMVLATCGGLVATGLAYWIVRALVALRPDALPRCDEIGIDWRVFAFSAASVVLVALVSSLPAGLRASRSASRPLLRTSTLAAPGGHRGMRGALVALQVAIAVVVLSVASLLVESVRRLADIRLGFEPAGVATFRIDLPTSRYPTGADRDRFHTRMTETMGALPGVTAVGLVSKLPVSGQYNTWSIAIAGGGPPTPGQQADVRCVSGGYLEALRIPRRRGRVFTEGDTRDRRWVAVISESMARAHWPGRDPIGERFAFGEPAGWWTIIGVVGDVYHDHRQSPVPTVYLAHAQIGDNRNWSMTYAVRAAASISDVPVLARAAARRLDPDLVIHEAATLEDVVARDIARPRFAATLMLGFGGLALLIAVAGLYAVVSYAVSERTREIGLRIAIGAGRAAIAWMALRSVARWATIGLLVGLPVTVAAGRLTAAVVADVVAPGPASLASAVAVLVAAAALAVCLPARRAARLDPIVALRTE